MSIDFLESVSMAVRTLSANKMRSSLSRCWHHHCNASVIAMVSVGQGAAVCQSAISVLGTNLLFVVPCGERSANGNRRVQ